MDDSTCCDDGSESPASPAVWSTPHPGTRPRPVVFPRAGEIRPPYSAVAARFRASL